MLSATVKKDDEGVRLLVSNISPLADEMKQVAIDMTLQLISVNDHIVKDLKQFLSNKEGGKSSITLELTLTGGK